MTELMKTEDCFIYVLMYCILCNWKLVDVGINEVDKCS
jgi:deoxycytidylate deaminase